MDGMGRLQREIRRMSLPTMWGFLCQALYDMVDMLFIGMMDKAAVAAATLFITVFWVLDILNEIVGASSVSMISQAWGAHDKERTRLVSQETLWFKVVLAIIGATVMIAVLPAYYRFFSDDPQVVGYGLSYGVIRLAFLPVFFSSYTVNTIFRCTGDAKTPMRLLVAASVINIVLDPLLMFSTVPGTTIPGLGLGIAGLPGRRSYPSHSVLVSVSSCCSPARRRYGSVSVSCSGSIGTSIVICSSSACRPA
jgi:Na+-driven multidrug efflux pump